MAPGVQSATPPNPTAPPQEKATALDTQPPNDQYGRYYPADPATLNLESNFGPMDPATIGYLQPTSADTPIEIMRERFERDGYLHVKRLLPEDPVLACRAAYFTHMSPSGLLDPAAPAVDGIYSRGADPRTYLPPGNLRRLFGARPGADAQSDAYAALLVSAHDAPFYTSFCESAALRDFVARLAGWPRPRMLRRTMLRALVPGGELTPVHFDQMYLRAGPPTSLTAWVPVGRVGLEGGGLMYLEGSTDVGRRTEEDFAARAGEMAEEERVSAFNRNMNDGGFLSRDTVGYGREAGRRWLVAEYDVGDVVFHNPWMVHASCKNMDPEGRIRLATDLRFVDPEKPYDKRWMKVYRPLDGL